MAVRGLPVRNGTRHVAELAAMSLHCLSATVHVRMGHTPAERLRLRSGLGTEGGGLVVQGWQLVVLSSSPRS